jgi:hypothetical protein
MELPIPVELTNFLTTRIGASNIVITNDGGQLTLSWTCTFTTPGNGEDLDEK